MLVPAVWGAVQQSSNVFFEPRGLNVGMFTSKEIFYTPHSTG